MSRQTRTPTPTVFHGMLATSEPMHELFRLVVRVAATEAPVLVRGETGTGKELVARAIHDLSPRRAGPFRAVNCATLTPELLASELFGHVRGAFTGAVRDHPGLFALADGGTLFLDEVAEIPLDIQARLLRVLQDHTFVPVGGTEPRRVDVRVVSATHRALRREVAEGRFREDLMYRIRVIPLFLPRLAERAGDVLALTRRRLEELNARGKRQITEIAPEAEAALLTYDWPGNVRELHNVLEYAYVMGDGPVLRVQDLTPELRGEPPPGEDGPPTAHDLERDQILAALARVHGRRDEAALALGWSRSTLWRKMREHRL